MNEEMNQRDALTALVMNDGELAELEARLSRFNLFRVLRADTHELRHSNMLAWLLDPSGSHGLGELFLRRWLKEVMHLASTTGANGHFTSPIWVDAASISGVQVRREWQNLDLLVELEANLSGKKEQWVIAIENKVNSRQGRTQLKGYRKTVEKRFPDPTRRFCVFLTKQNELPADSEWLVSTYADVLQALQRCVAERKDAIGPEPLFLIRQYIELVSEDFMDESDSVQLARAIYQRHAAAIDFIFECKIDPIFELTNRIEKKLADYAKNHGIIMSRSGKGRIRFIPQEWATPKNAEGHAWGENGHYLLIELDFYTKTVELNIVAGDAPEDWTDAVWERCAKAPLQRSQKAKPRRFLKAYRGRSNIQISGMLELDIDTVEEEIFEWVTHHLESEKFKSARDLLSGFLIDLH